MDYETIQKNQERVINDLIEIFNIKRPIFLNTYRNI